MSTGIEWTQETWNPTTGCDRVSAGCDNCYALTMAKRLKAMGSADYQTDGDPKTSGPGFGIASHDHRLDQPLRWKKPRKVFVNSMSDLFHDGVPIDHLAAVFATMAAAPQHTFQILTKRHARMRSLLNGELRERTSVMLASWWDEWGDPRYDVDLDKMWPLPNVWLGVSVENQQWADIRIPALLETPAAVRWLSCEPLLGPVDLLGKPDQGCDEMGPAITHSPYSWQTSDGPTEYDCQHNAGIDWVVAGGESGRGARPMHPDWARSLRDQCVEMQIPFLFKQWGSWAPTRYVGAGITRPNRVFVPDSTVPDPREGRELERTSKHAAGRELDGRTWDQYPAATS